MKILRISLILLAIAVGTMAMAQDIDTLVFVDEAGNIIPDGTEITVKGLIDDGFQDPYIESGVFVQNTTDERVGTSMLVTVTRIDSGRLDCCFPSTCQSFTTTDSRETVKGTFGASATNTMNTEWFPTSYGTCTAVCQLQVYAVNGLVATDKVADGPTITINFVYDETSAGISDIAVEASPVVGYYTLDGRQLAAPQTGLTVVKYADGKSIKTICK